MDVETVDLVPLLPRKAAVRGGACSPIIIIPSMARSEKTQYPQTEGQRVRCHDMHSTPLRTEQALIWPDTAQTRKEHVLYR